jgi:transglutaminase-like putative cysteine protease
MLQSLHHLPREARDTLFLLGVIGWVILPQFARLPWWCSVLAVTLLLWRGVLAWGSRPLPSRWWLLGLLGVAVAATWLTYRTVLGRDAGVTLIVVLLALKTLEMRARRDAFVIFFLGFFTMLSNFFFSQSLLTAAAMVVALLGLLTALVNSHMPVGRPPLAQAARTAGWMALAGAPIMAALFVLFPRIAPLWGMPGDAMSGRSGLSGQMQVGTIASLALDDSIAMRIRFEGALPRQSDMYFRGPVFSTFDGREWRPLRSAFPARMQLQPDLSVSGPAYRYQVTLAANNRPWLMVLEATPQAPDIRGLSATMGPELQWQADQPIADLVRYSATSYPEFRHGPLRPSVGLQDYLDLPPGFNPRTLQLAAELRRQPQLASAGAPVLVEAVLAKLRTGGYEYTLEPGVYGTHTADEFWFDRKAGFCEHIASSFVLLMRALDVPARVVTGYQGGQMNPVDGFWTVRQSDAHAWAEVWMPARGWVRVDPTSAVSPGRTGSFQRLQVQPGVLAQAINAVSPGFTVNLRALWEATNNRWNQWVLNYSQAKQMDLLRNLGFSAPDWQDLSTVFIGLIVTSSLAGAGWSWWRRQGRDPWLQLLELARARVQATGLPVPEGCTPRALAQLLASDPRAHPDAVQWLLALEALRYGKSGSATALRQARQQLRTLRWLKA